MLFLKFGSLFCTFPHFFADGINDSEGATGGAGDDTYSVSRTTTRVVEAAGGGLDTVYASVDYTLPANVEKLVLTGSATHGTSNAAGGTIMGNDNGDTLTGGAGTDILIGGAGNDRLIAGSGTTTLTGGGGMDTFVFGPAFVRAEVTDFNATADRLDLSALAGHSFTLTGTNGGTMMAIGGVGNIFFDAIGASALAGSSGLSVHSIKAVGATWSGVI